MSLILPRRRRYKLAAIEQQEILLPFVRYTPERDYPHYWQMPETSEDFDAMCAYGRECAAHLLQWLKDNRYYVGCGLLGRVARDISFDDREQRGYWIGFFNYLEQMLFLGAQQVKVYRHVDSQHQMHAGKTRRRQLEERFSRIGR
ncbi:MULTISPECIES: hypothetical protein [Chromobacterium]|uniref:Uncharacterized protein n=2 Tax=Chromobacterium TaxID=535 RepID=A0ABS3GKT0_9NEIS|nr:MULTISPECIES: hypothetical protein [Chromobacterium]AXT45963.1 hypothetical protein D1345_07125 [Chromobacterium rhizoryzae]MBK0414078.1 hypothetical protein [Chromobacterium haemolyticum]MBO0415235.1 hypothetical protein [Chromobacterium haemolyticum]MBO0498496.1 hypothetical protein [Chromobacterium haemolyticum]MDH0344374.1 hypothetical protein [Chromobacterium haemolyticum]